MPVARLSGMAIVVPTGPANANARLSGMAIVVPTGPANANARLSGMAIVVPIKPIANARLNQFAVVAVSYLTVYKPPQPIAKLPCQVYCFAVYKRISGNGRI